ncbi:SMP-30/gluconolactonase/LRE family protein [Microbacterium esteraromaticum]|uniref:SMP-30/gluconolactonase/LRE family protein n=1 Tax=Microbacterium esteraromaticum TaxID=57043 RepID=UPI0019586BDE|nr:SMP-30/gluconolactonase/LRE family protein [Microbacterium esteraromaticum]MBM7466203.1 sugar lactone lactonase YvrE [Microbacterium esteraromaticum]
MRVHNVTGPIAGHAEGPVWAAAWGGLRWVDAAAGDLLTLRDDGVVRQHVDDEFVAFVRPRRTGGFVAAGARTLYLADEADGETRAVARLGDDPGVRMNDGCCDPDGRLLAGSMAYDSAAGRGSLRRIDADLSISTVLPEVTVSNGIGFTSEGSQAYYADTATGRVDVFDVSDGELVGRRPLVTIPSEIGAPDGLCIDHDGNVWVALWGGSAVQAYDASGALIERIELPVPQVSACTFGGTGLGTLFITTSAQGLDPDHGTEAGSLFAVDLGVRGLPTLPFAG